MPGVLITEAMAQTSIILYSVNKPDIAKAHPDYYLGKVKAEFLSPVYPGDQLVIEVRIIKILDNAAITDCIAKVNNLVAAKANLVFGIKPKELHCQYPMSHNVKNE
jgi:3-hydroxyacyl-[acyl-carrier-protein] dehydratase